MNPPKVVWAAIAFGILLISGGFLIGQTGSLFGLAGHGGNHITGTIVLTDKDVDFSYLGNVALPGTTCNVIITQCGIGVIIANGNVVPAFLKSRNIDKVGANWPANANNPRFTEYVPISQPIGVREEGGAILPSNCTGAEYRDLLADNYIVGIVNIKRAGPGLLDYGEEIVNSGDAGTVAFRNVTVSYKCTV